MDDGMGWDGILVVTENGHPLLDVHDQTPPSKPSRSLNDSSDAALTGRSQVRN